MVLKTFTRRASPLALSILVAACGGGNSTSESVPNLGAANGNNTGTDTQTPDLDIVSGRVADGYINGATVCVDLNENELCDEGEPSVVTTAGGAYDLAIPPEAAGKSIVADIPAEAIDEDTGQPVGAPLVFIAPADRPEFISPITTLVHQELQDNPALNVDDAENAVKTILGIEGEDVSLFTDYVAGGSDVDSGNDTSASFRYLHDTARVVASMMKDIETQVENAAVSQGVDVVGNETTQQAIREIVRAEVRDLLPQIARQVAELVVDESGAEGEDSQAGTSDSASDLARIAMELRPTDAGTDIETRIQAVSEKTETIQADIKRLLTDGMYWMEFDCEYEYEHYDAGNTDTEKPDQGTDVSLENYSPEYDADEQGSAYVPVCQAYYGKVQLDADGSTLYSEDYALEPSGWVVDEDEDADRITDFSLVSGKWVPVLRNGPDGQVSFDEDGTALITNDEGTMHLKAVTQTLDAQPVLHHFWDGQSDPVWFELVQPEALFASGSQAHTVSIQQSSHPYVLFNYQPYGDVEGSECVEYGNNCNVVKSLAQEQSTAVTSIDNVLEATSSGIDIVTHGMDFGPVALMSLSAKVTADGALPKEGVVEWKTRSVDDNMSINPTDGEYDPAGIYPVGQAPMGHCEDQAYADKELVVDEDSLPGTSNPEPGSAEAPDCHELARQTEVVYEPEEYTGEVKPSVDEKYTEPSSAQARVFVSSWKLIEVEGQRMIEIALPLALKHGDGYGAEEALLLIEHEGFVRMGGRFADSNQQRVVTYNESAFTQLRAIVESALIYEPPLQ